MKGGSSSNIFKPPETAKVNMPRQTGLFFQWGIISETQRSAPMLVRLDFHAGMGQVWAFCNGAPEHEDCFFYLNYEGGVTSRRGELSTRPALPFSKRFPPPAWPTDFFFFFTN